MVRISVEAAWQSASKSSTSVEWIPTRSLGKVRRILLAGSTSRLTAVSNSATIDDGG